MGRFLRYLAVSLAIAITFIQPGSFAYTKAFAVTSDQALTQVLGSEAFLAGQFVEVGVRANGAFGSSSTVPAGFHKREAGGLGFVAMRDTSYTSWTSALAASKVDGDFFVPGTPYEGWGIRIGSNRATNNHNTTNIAGALSSLTVAASSSASHTVDWNANSAYQGVSIAKTYSVPDDGQSLNISVTLTNTTGGSINEIYYGRGVDPDNTTGPGVYTSTNTVVAQYATEGYSFVKATWTNGSQVSLFSSDSRAKVGRESGGFSQTFDPKSVWDSSGFITTVGSAGTADAGMNLVVYIPTLAGGESTTFSYSYLLTEAAATAAVQAASAPSAPSVSPSAGAVTVSWDQPRSNDPIVGYRIKYSADGGSNWTIYGTDFRGDSTPRESVVSGLNNGTAYIFQVAALTGDIDNSPTVGSWSASSDSVIPGGATAPTISSVSAGNAKLTVAFTAPSETGGFAISDYEYSTDNGSTWTSAGTTASPITLSGLTNGTTYQVKLRGKGSFSGVASSASTGTPAATVPDAPTITSVAATAGTLTVTFTAPVDNGGAAISNYKWSTDGTNYRAVSPSQTTSPIVLTTLSSDGTTILVDGTAYPITLKAVNSNGDSVSSNSVSGTPGAVRSSSTSTTTRTEPVVVPPVIVPTVPPRVTTTPGTAVPVVQSGPVLTRGVVPVPPKAPTVVLGGRPTLMSVTVPTTTQLDVKAGRLSLGVKVLEDQGTISEADDGTTQIAVKKGASATITGSGFKPAATVQVFLPLQGDNAKELARIPVGTDGSFDGSAPFATRPNEAPLPVGKQVLQLVSLDNDGNQVVVEMTVNIAQGAPAPEANRIEGVIPAMQPGQSIATSGGEPVPVTITPVSDQKLAVVEGDGWTMAVNVNSDQGGVEPAEGGALLKLVRNESALVSGSGFMAGTRADVWLFSDPTLLGTVTIDENGEFTGEVNIDPNMIPVGQHTLQLQGVGEDGYVKAANMGVLVDDPVEAVTDTATASLTFLWWIVAAVLVVLVFVVVLVSRRRRGQD